MVSGIYKIVCSANGRQYIGSSKDMPNRWENHRRKLESKLHDNNHLQNAWNKYGSSVFEFNVIEYTDNLLIREQHWIDAAEKNSLFNMCFIAGAPPSPLGRKMKDSTKTKIVKILTGHKVSEQTRQKISKSLKGRRLSPEARIRISENLRLRGSPSFETREKIAEANIGKIRSNETRKKLSDSHIGKKLACGPYRLISPEGLIYTVTEGIKSFCEEHDLVYQNVITSTKTKYKTKGWTAEIIK